MRCRLCQTGEVSRIWPSRCRVPRAMRCDFAPSSNPWRNWPSLPRGTPSLGSSRPPRRRSCAARAPLTTRPASARIARRSCIARAVFGRRPGAACRSVAHPECTSLSRCAVLRGGAKVRYGEAELVLWVRRMGVFLDYRARSASSLPRGGSALRRGCRAPWFGAALHGHAEAVPTYHQTRPTGVGHRHGQSQHGLARWRPTRISVAVIWAAASSTVLVGSAWRAGGRLAAKTCKRTRSLCSCLVRPSN